MRGKRKKLADLKKRLRTRKGALKAPSLLRTLKAAGEEFQAMEPEKRRLAEAWVERVFARWSKTELVLAIMMYAFESGSFLQAMMADDIGPDLAKRLMDLEHRFGGLDDE